MDGILLILASWVVVALLCYFFILTYSRRAVGPVQSTTSEPESVKSFQRDVLTWLFWGLDENARNQHQKLAPIFEQFVTKSLNDSSHRLHLRQKEHRPEVHFDAVHLRDKSTIAALQSFRIHPNRTPGNHLSVSGKVAHTRAKGGPIFIKISVTEAEAQTQFGGGKVPTLNSPAIRRHSVNVHELIGDIEIRIASIAGELFVIGCFKERPVVQLELVETNDEPRKAFLEEFVQRCIRGAVMNFSLGELLYPDTGSIRASRARLSAEYRDLSFLQEIYPPGSEQNSQHDSAKFPTDDRDLSRAKADLSAYCLIQLLDVTDLRISHSGDERFVVSLELDFSASERFLSPKAHSDHYQTNRIYWNEDEANFELQIGPDSRELLIELYSEADYPEPSQTVFNTVRKRTFRGMSILGVAELRAIVQQQRGGGGLVRLQLQGRPEMGKPAQQQSAEVRGVLTLKCSLQYERPRPNQGSIAAAEYAQIKRNRSSPSNGHPQQNDEQPKSKKSSTGTLSHGSMSMKRGLPRQKQHYIYNVTDDRPAFDRNGIQTDESPQRGGSSSKMSSGGETSLTPMRPNYGEQQQLGIHKTISDTNALFQFERVEERKRSAPETPVMAQKEGACADQRKPIVDEAPEPLKEDTFDQLFNGEKTKAHPAMEIFKVPEGLQTKGPNEDTGEIERRARERDRKAHGQKQKRNFFEQIKDRLSGPVQLLRRQGKRAKSLDVYDQLEEVVSSPQSRDPSQTRHGEEGKRSTAADRQQQGRQLFIRSAASSTAASTSNLHTGPQTSTKRTFPYAESQLILEFIGPEHEGPRYYYIPLEISTEPAVVKLMQSGKKLHVHNAHILVASKARGRIVCSICGKRIGGNFSNRQAYQCRDCRIVCHKNCHRQIDWVCENSSFFNLAEGGHIEEVDWEEYLRHHQLREFISIGNL